MNRFATATSAIALFVGLVAAPAQAEEHRWDIDPNHSSVGFVAKHLVVAKVRGKFQKYDAKLIIDDKNIENSTMTVEIEAASIDTDNERRDNHLRSDDFFAAKDFPKLTFVSKSVKRKGKDKLSVVGDLTIRGTTRTVVLDVDGPSPEFKDPGGNPHLAFSATTTINRFDYGLKWNKAVEGTSVVGEEIKIELEIELFKKRPAKNS
jgi:polyisoprenoid-binding protein YceI